MIVENCRIEGRGRGFSAPSVTTSAVRVCR